MFSTSGIKITLASTVMSLAIVFSANAIAAEEAKKEETAAEPIVVTVDRAKVFRVSEPAATVIIGNPSIADAAVEDERTLVLTGRSFGVTNLIVLGASGDPVVDRTLVVKGHETNTVRIYRRAYRETMACAPVCEPTLTIGDNEDTFDYASRQIQQRNALSEPQN